MNIEKLAKLHEGQVFKNYKELCNFLNIKYCGGNSKKIVISYILNYFEIVRDGNKIVIGKNLNKNIVTQRVTKQNKYLHCYKNFNIDLSKKNFIGVYCITLKNEIYIGSTITSLGTRYLQHKNNNGGKSEKTYSMIKSGGIFSALSIYDPSQNIEEKQIREEELNYINSFRKNPDWIVVNSDRAPSLTKTNLLDLREELTQYAIQKNWSIIDSGSKPSSSLCKCLSCGATKEFANITIRKSPCICYNCRKKIGKSKYIKVSEKDYDKAIKILLENNINIVNK